MIVGLNIPREILYSKINERVEKMIHLGLIQEVNYLYNELKLDYNKHQSMKGIGYKEVIDYFQGKYSLEECIELIKKHTRNYAKRQMTWFKRNENIIWYNPLENSNIVSEIVNILKKKHMLK